MTPSPPEAPRRLGKYRVEGVLAEGGMGTVYRCRIEGEEGFRKRLAAKVVHPRHARDGNFRERFLAEARLSASLVHPNLVQVFDFGRERELLYLVMERIEGFDLAAAAAHARFLGTAVPPCLVRHWADGLLGGLAYLHGRGIVHGDVAPSNVLVTREGAVKLGDFGLSRRGGRGEGGGGDGEPRPDAWAGKAGYAAPEVVRGGEGEPRSDLFSAAVTVAELLLPRRLFPGAKRHEYPALLATFDPSLLPFPRGTEALAEALLPSLSPEPGARHSDAHAFRAAVRAAGAEPSVRELQDGWDLLFPVDGAEEETVLQPPGGGTAARGAVVAMEEGKRYGKGVKAGAAAIALLVAGAVSYLSRPGESTKAPPGGGTPPPDRPASVAAPPPTAGAGAAPAVSAPARPAPPPPAGPRRTAPAAASAAASPTRDDPAPGVDLPRGGDPATVPPGVPPGGAAAGTLPPGEPAPPAASGTYEAIQATPWARVYHGDRSLGETPVFGAVLPAGEQTLRFVNEELAVERAVRVTVKPGSNGKLILRLRD